MGRDAEEPDEGFQFIGDGADDGDATSVDESRRLSSANQNAKRSGDDADEFEFVGDEDGSEAVEPELSPDAAEPSDSAAGLGHAPEASVGAAVEEQGTLVAGGSTRERSELRPASRDSPESSDHPPANADLYGSEENEDHDERGEHGKDHAHPVVEDWPRGVGEASWWPIVTAGGAAGIYASVALWLLGRGEGSLVAAAVGPTAFVGALAVTLFGVYGWLYHGFVAHFWTRGTDRLTARSLRWATLLFVVSEIATFGALFAYYFYVRAGPWPPAGGLAGGVDLVNVLVVANTAVLLLSSLTVHFAHHALARGNRERFTRLLTITAGLGLLFLAGQAVEYHRFINREGFDWTSGVLGSAFFGLTGLHGAHVAFGTLLLGITLFRGKHGQFDAERDVSVALVSLYWHFVDAVWLFLVAVLYVGASYGG